MSANLITSGLLMQLDANDSNSYSGSGTTVYDLTNNYDHTLTSGATFTNLDGVKCFDCTTGSKRVVVNGTGPTLPTNGYTYITWARLINNNSGFRTLLYTKEPVRYTPITIQNGGSLLGYWNTPNSEFISSGYDASAFQGAWAQYAVVGDSASQKYYVNGSQAGSEIAYGVGGDEHWGWGNNHVPQPWGHIANLYVYNRKLALSEIQEQYNFLSSRFFQTMTPNVKTDSAARVVFNGRVRFL